MSGYIRDAETGEELIQSSIAVVSTPYGITTNQYGFYSLTLPEGEYTFRCSFLGYRMQEFRVRLDRDIRNDLHLVSSTVEMAEMLITGRRDDANVKSIDMGVVTLDVAEAQTIPVLLGEHDILKTLQLMPGVSANTEGSSGFFVRGGDVDQNLILLDEAPVYNASHLLGFFSIFNSDALKDMKLYKGSIPAQYGGRISSVLDIRMKNGNSKEWVASGGIGLISSRVTLEGPIASENASVMISARRTYADVVLKATGTRFDDLSLYFYDLNTKINYTLGTQDRVFLSGYFGRDVFGVSNSGFDWGNTTGTLRWNHLFNEQLFSNTTFIYSDFSYGFKVDRAGSLINLASGIQNLLFKNDLSWYADPATTVLAGIAANYYLFRPGVFSQESVTSSASLDIPQERALEMAAYVSNEHRIGQHLTLLYGIRVSAFSNIGPSTVRSYDANDAIVAASSAQAGEFYNTYVGIEPRVNATYVLDDVTSMKASVNRSFQYIHLLSNSTSGTPTDLWIPSSRIVRPEVSDQYSFGVFRNFDENTWEFSLEGYYKNLLRQVDYEDGADTYLNPNIEAELVFGRGYAYGAELLLRKTGGDVTGWIAYTLSTSKRQYDAIGDGGWFSARQDRTHNLAIVGSYKISPAWSLSANLIYYTGDAVTFPVAYARIDGANIPVYSSRNGDRMPDYHRLDIGATWTISDRPGWHSDINFSVYNLYNQHNAYSISFRESETNPGTNEAVRLSLFGIVPAITWNFTF